MPETQKRTTFGSIAPLSHIPAAQHGDELGYVFVRPTLGGLWGVEKIRVSGRNGGLRLISLQTVEMPELSAAVRDAARGGLDLSDVVKNLFSLMREASWKAATWPSGLSANALGGELPCDEPIEWTFEAARLRIHAGRLLLATFRSTFPAPIALPTLGATCVQIEPAPPWE